MKPRTVQEIREQEQCGYYEAKRIWDRERLLRAIKDARNLEEVKQVVRDIILEMKL